VTLYDIETNTVWRRMSLHDGEHEITVCRGLDDILQEYDTSDRRGNPLRVVLQIDAPGTRWPHDTPCVKLTLFERAVVGL
jgi:hypothetical protein